MKDRDTKRHLIASAAFAFLLAVTVIVMAGYYESPLLLIAQLLLIAGPTFAAFLPLPRVGQTAIVSWLVIAAVGCVVLVGGIVIGTRARRAQRRQFGIGGWRQAVARTHARQARQPHLTLVW